MKDEINPILKFWEIKGGESGGPCATAGSDWRRVKVWSCEGCERGWQQEDLDTTYAVAEGKKAKIWPDFLLGFTLIISERVLEDLIANGITGYISHKVRMDRIDSPRLQKIPSPDYYLLEMTGHVEVDRQWFDEGEGFICPVCHIWTPKQGGKYGFGARMLVPLMETWDGSDFLHIRQPFVGRYLCTRRVVELARARRWFNASISPITPRPFQVNLESDNWFAEIEEKARAEYPHFFTQPGNAS